MKTLKFHLFSKCLGITSRLSVGALIIQVSQAGNTWTGTTNQDWNTAANWGGAVPVGNATINTATGNFAVISGNPSFTPVDVFVGIGASGRLDQNAGTAATGNGNWMFVGVNSGTGTVNLTGAGSFTAGRYNVGGSQYYSGGTGTLNMNTSGSLTVTGGGNNGVNLGLALGFNSGGSGTLNLDNGTVNNSMEMWVGGAGNGTVNQTGGTLNASSYLVLGRDAGGVGNYTMSGGTVNAATGGGFTILGSTRGATGTLSVSGGTFNSTAGMFVGEGWTGTGTATGTLNISGGGLVKVGTAGVQIGLQSGSTGTVNLNGGTLLTTAVSKGGGSAGINFNGGKLKASQSTATFMTGLNAANVQSGGAVIDSNGFNIGIGQSLLNAGGGGGLTKQGSGTLTLAGANTYAGATNIAAGTLALAAGGSIDNTSGVSLGAGGTFDVSAKSGGYTVANLSGAGDVIGTLTVTSQLAIGNSPGTATFDNLIVGSGATYLHELTGGGAAADLGDVDGNLALTGSILDLVQLGTYTMGNEFTLFAYESLTGTFAGLADDSIFTDAGGDWLINYDDSTAGLNGGSVSGSPGSGFVTITAVPEPQAELLGGLAVLALFRRRRLK